MMHGAYNIKSKCMMSRVNII
jgi:hypothetical protein